jgi:uncharacterized protein (DUF433 family)
MAATLVNIGDLIAVNSDRPMIAGTRTAVGRIATLHQQGYSVDEIVADKDYLSLAQVYAALAYYFANQRQIDRIWRRKQRNTIALLPRCHDRHPFLSLRS